MDDARPANRLADRVIMTDSEPLILVDEGDRRLGHLAKSKCHEGRGVLHRAFSLLIFNERGELLIQQRSAEKRLWPLYWSNSCCSHPRRAESMAVATRRRLREELGMDCDLQFLFKFQYHAQFDATGAEHELCSVFIGRTSAEPRVDPAEVADWRWAAPEILQRQMSQVNMSRFTPWFILEWRRIWRDHRGDMLALRA